MERQQDFLTYSSPSNHFLTYSSSSNHFLLPLSHLAHPEQLDGVAAHLGLEGVVPIRLRLASASASASPDFDGDGDWKERFRRHTDSRPRGPQSVSFDVSFHGADFVYGVPEHALSSSLALRPTRGPGVDFSEPYRLFNLDVFESLQWSWMVNYW